MTRRPATYRAGRPSRRNRGPARGGQVMAIVLLAILPLVGLVMLVMCIGDQVNRKVRLQTAADAAAEAAAKQAARNMNLVAADNLYIARMLAAIVTLDDLERCLRNSSDQADAFLRRVADQQEMPLPADAFEEMTSLALTTVRSTLDDERARLDYYLSQVDSMDLRSQTTWKPSGGGTPNGYFWRAAMKLHDISVATMENWDTLVQGAAISAAAENGLSAMVIPFKPDDPSVAGSWSDWHYPIDSGQVDKQALYGTSAVSSDAAPQRDTLVQYGWTPDLYFPPRFEDYSLDQIRELEIRPGPFWSLYQWRSGIAGYASTPTGPTFNLGIPGRGVLNPLPTGPNRQATVTKWRSYGPIEWMMWRMFQAWIADLRYATVLHVNSRGRVEFLLNELQRAKLTYMFDKDYLGTGRTISAHWPDWDTDYDNVSRRVNQLGETPNCTIYFSVYCFGADQSPESLAASANLDDLSISNATRPGMAVFRGWYSHNGQTSMGQTARAKVTLTYPNPSAELPDGMNYDNLPETFYIPLGADSMKPWEKVADHIWQVRFDAREFEDQYRAQIAGITREDICSLLGLPLTYPMTYSIELADKPWSYIHRDIFAGSDFGDDVEVHNPANFEQADLDRLPVPRLLNLPQAQDYGDPDEDFRRTFLSFTSVAWESAAPAVWSERFGTANAYGLNTAFARAETFNTRSADLWTQDWRGQMIPVGQTVGDLADLDIDTAFLEQIQADIPVAQGFDARRLSDVVEMLTRMCQDSQAMEEVTTH